MYQWVEQCLKEEYKLVRVLKQTTDSSTLVMKHKKSGTKLLVKHIHGDGEVYRYLLDIRQKNLPQVYEVVHEKEGCLILEEYIDGITIGDILQGGLYHRRGVKKVLTQLCDAVGFLHDSGIVHRDIKPENVMIDNMGCVKLIDFDTARFYKKTSQKDTDSLGTIGYAAPEQFGITQTDRRTDIFAIGVLINVMLTGEHPSRRFCKGRYKWIVKKCTQMNPKDRYTSVYEIKRRL